MMSFSKTIVSLLPWRHKQPPRLDVQRLRDLLDVAQGNIPDAAFDRRNVGSVQLALERQLFLGDVLLKAQAANVIGEYSSQGFLEFAELGLRDALWHAPEDQVWRCLFPRCLLLI